MFFKEEIVRRVYWLYLNGTSLCAIAIFCELSETDVDEIIDYMNEIYV